MPPVYDAIVIGAGHNGLVAAAMLQRAGLNVHVVEQRDIVGGACVTEEVWPGYRVSTAAYLCSLLQPEIVADLELERHGFEVYRRETAGFAPYLDGSRFMLHGDSARTRAELEAFCHENPEDVDAYFAFEAEVERVTELIEPFFSDPPPGVEALRTAFAAHGMASLYSEFIEGNVADLLDARFRSDRLKAVLATDGLIGTYGGVDTPGTAYVLIHHYIGRILGTRGAWAYVRGGMGRITQALAASFTAAGGTIRTNAPVKRIVTDLTPQPPSLKGRGSQSPSLLESAEPAPVLPSPLAGEGPPSDRCLHREARGAVRGETHAVAQPADGIAPLATALPSPLEGEGPGVRSPGVRFRVIGVELDSGEILTAPIVLCNADPYRMLSLIDLPEIRTLATTTTIGNLKSQGGASAKINLAVTELPRFTCLPDRGPGDDVGPEHLGTVHLCEGMQTLRRAWDEASRGLPSTEPMIEVYLQTATDRSLAPPGRHILSLFVQYFPYNLASGLDLDTERERFADRVIEIVGRYAPNVPDSIVHRQVLTPRDIEARFGLTGGHIFHGDLLPPNVWSGRPAPGFHGAQTPISGLYLCGSGAHPGGCVCGAPGANAARAVLIQRNM